MRRTHIPLRRRGAVAAGSVLAIMLGGWLALDVTSASAQSVSAQQEESQNWSGYVVKSTAGKSFSSVSGSWVQPAVSSSSSSPGYSAFWVGIGGAGQSSQALEQVGTSAQVVNGQTTYSAWYELVPAAEVSLPLTIHPGDHMTGRVNVDGTSVTIYLSDQTTGHSVTKTLQMANPDTSSAEWIAEAPAAESPDGSAQVLPLANFGNVTFSNASATADGHTGSISDPAWTVAQVNMTSQPTALDGGGGFVSSAPAQQSASGATAGGLGDNGTSFTVSYSSQSAGSSGGSAGYGSSGGSAGYGSSGGSAGYGYPGDGYGYDGYGYPGYGDPGSGYQGYGDPGSGYPGVYIYVQ